METKQTISPKKSGMIFERTEKKFLITKEQYLALRKKWKGFQVDDEYGLTNISNVYYDTDDYRLIRNSLEKPDYKEKFRIRSYGIANGEDMVFLEIKKKVNGIVYKRRMRMAYDECLTFLANPDAYEANTQIGKEIQYMFHMYGLTPKMFIGYDRIATYNINDPDLRVTFDFNIHARENDLGLHSYEGEGLFDSDDVILMEVKIDKAYPSWMVKDFAELGIHSLSFSKYGSFYKKKLSKEYVYTKEQEAHLERNYHLCLQV